MKNFNCENHEKNNFAALLFAVSCADKSDNEVLVYTLATPENYKYLDENVKVSYEIVQPQTTCLDAYMSAISKVIEHKGRLYIMAAENNSILVLMR